ncbi:MAG: His/Gly/Thr/Pro-type tRNA ligase C-terminal domain-containing protein, partial [Nanoarchaeota archaeon]
RTLFLFPNKLVPIDVAVFPLVNKDGLPEKTEGVYSIVRKDFNAFFDSKGSIGKMYRRMDEAGCPYMITIDHQTLKDDTITVRNIVDMKQRRVKIKELNDALKRLLNDEIKFGDMGLPFK